MRRVEADVSDAVVEHLERRLPDADARRLDIVVTARCIAAALFGAMEVWMQRDQRTMADLAEISHATLTALESGLDSSGMFRHY
jgi:hypothetical protein